jgi:hypothetical protein
MDCAGSCIGPHDEALSWIGDGYCDAGEYGLFFNCPALGCDGGDCNSAECDMGNPGEMCYFGIDGGLGATDTYWIFGDVFLRKVCHTCAYIYIFSCSLLYLFVLSFLL